MRKFILTHHQLPGQIELVFDRTSSIAMVDFQNATLSSVQTDFFLKECPRFTGALEAFVKKNNFTCVESDIKVTFEMFWDKYALKLDRKRTLAIWNKLPISKQIAAYYGIDKYDRYLRRTDWRNKCEAKTYLLNERWENEWK